MTNNQANKVYNFEQQNHFYTKVFHCQICRDQYHEALFCYNAVCVYCKSKDHISYFCNNAKNKLELFCKLCNHRGHSVDKCTFNQTNEDYCQYCQIIGHKATQCPVIKKYELDCEYCGSTGHSTKDCLSAVCMKCNKLGHWMKYCPINEKIIWCTICNEEDHGASDCEYAKKLMMQNKQQTFGNKITCQICEAVTHTAAYCPDRNTSSQMNTNYTNINPNYRSLGNKYTYHTQSNSRNTNGFNKIQQQNYKPRNMIFHNQQSNTVNRKRIQCAYCKRSGHDIDNCRKLKNLIESDTRKNHCDFCKNTDHITEECEILKPYPNINTVESYHNSAKETINESKIQENKINTTNIGRYNDNELITENKLNKNKQESNIIEKFATINEIVEPFIIINEIKIADESKVNKLIMKNHENTNEINLIDFNKICKNNNEIENIKKTNLIDIIESTVKDYETNDKMNFNEPDIKNHEVCDEINVIDSSESNVKSHEDDDEIDLINCNESDINKQKYENSYENNEKDNNSFETVTFYDDLKVIFEITSALAESFESEYVQIETKFQQNPPENSLKENIGLIHSEDSLLNDTKNLKNLLNNSKLIFENDNQLKDIFDNQELQKHLENKNHLKIFDNQEHQEQLENKRQLKETLDNQDHNIIINLNTNPNKVHQLRLVFNYPIKVTCNKNVRKLRWISNYKEDFKEFLKNTKLKLKSKDYYKEYFKEFLKNTKLKLKAEDYYNKFNTKKNFKKGDKTWPIKKPNKNKVERDKHKNSQCYWNKIISTSKDNNK